MTDKGKLKAILENHKLWLEDNTKGQRADLSRANLSRVYLGVANLRGANLGGANFRGADLSRADLSGANLSGAYLSEADLSVANLSGANLSEADLSVANLRGADLREADLSRADLIDGGQDIRGYRFVGQPKDGTLWVLAGCRYFDLSQAKAHWSSNPEALAKVLMIETTAKIRGFIA